MTGRQSALPIIFWICEGFVVYIPVASILFRAANSPAWMKRMIGALLQEPFGLWQSYLYFLAIALLPVLSRRMLKRGSKSGWIGILTFFPALLWFVSCL